MPDDFKINITLMETILNKINHDVPLNSNELNYIGKLIMDILPWTQW